SPVWPSLFRQVAMNIFVSESTRAGWLKSGIVSASRSVLVYNGISDELFSPASDFADLRRRMSVGEKEKIVLYVGRLIPRKGVETLIEAFARLRAQGGERAQLWLVGDQEDTDSYVDVLRALAVRLGIEPHVRFFGFQ